MAKPDKKKNQTIIQVTALDAILNVNTLFTASVFLGISFSSDPSSDASNCPAGPDVAKRLVLFEMISFSCFLFSTLTIQGLKIHLNLINSKYADDPVHAELDRRRLNFFVIASGIGSFLGCAFLMVSIVHVVEIRLGSLSCGNKFSVPAVSVLSVSIFLGFVMYLYNVGHGILDQRHESPSPMLSMVSRGVSMQMMRTNSL